MITTELYEEYFGVNTAPEDLTRLEYLSLQEIKKLITKEIPDQDNEIYEDFQKALLEQIKFFYDNDEVLTMSGAGYSLGKFKEGSVDIQYNQTRISPMTYAILLNIGMLYVGLGC
jgi:hypothetical protein